MGLKAKRLEEEVPDFPWPLEYLWRDFNEIAAGLSANGFAVPSISWDVLQAWSLLRGIALHPGDALTLVRLGALRAEVLSEEQPKPDAGSNKDRKHSPRRQHHHSR